MYGFLGFVLSIVIVGIVLKGTMGNASFIVDQNELVTAKVVRGNFRVDVRATGVLKPQDIHWVSSQVAGRVEQVRVKAGAHVQKGDILLKLSNPTLIRELQTARWELEASKAESHAAYVLLESQLVDLKNSTVAAEYQFKSAKLKLDAETELMNQGNATVSQLEYQKSQLAEKQQKQYWLSQQEKITKMKANMEATKIAQKARVGLVENNYQRVREQVEALTVRAAKSGVVQQVSLELGEQAQVGDSVALIADQHSLFAELEVQEVRVRDITIGQPVVIDTRTSQIQGQVSRIDPAVSGGMVIVDVVLTEPLPDEARPELTVDGLIEISNIEDTLFVKRPMFAPRNTTVELFKVTQNQQFAQKSRVSLGQSSVNKIQILSGLNAGDQIVISDTSSWQDHKEVLIN